MTNQTRREYKESLNNKNIKNNLIKKTYLGIVFLLIIVIILVILGFFMPHKNSNTVTKYNEVKLESLISEISNKTEYDNALDKLNNYEGIKKDTLRKQLQKKKLFVDISESIEELFDYEGDKITIKEGISIDKLDSMKSKIEVLPVEEQKQLMEILEVLYEQIEDVSNIENTIKNIRNGSIILNNIQLEELREEINKIESKELREKYLLILEKQSNKNDSLYNNINFEEKIYFDTVEDALSFAKDSEVYSSWLEQGYTNFNVLPEGTKYYVEFVK